MLRYRNLLVRQAVRMKNKVAGLLMELGEPYDAQRLHRKNYFYPLVEQLNEIPESVRELLWISRGQMETFCTTAFAKASCRGGSCSRT